MKTTDIVDALLDRLIRAEMQKATILGENTELRCGIASLQATQEQLQKDHDLMRAHRDRIIVEREALRKRITEGETAVGVLYEKAKSASEYLARLKPANARMIAGAFNVAMDGAFNYTDRIPF